MKWFKATLLQVSYPDQKLASTSLTIGMLAKGKSLSQHLIIYNFSINYIEEYRDARIIISRYLTEDSIKNLNEVTSSSQAGIDDNLFDPNQQKSYLYSCKSK